jgi:hypothetical protein
MEVRGQDAPRVNLDLAPPHRAGEASQEKANVIPGFEEASASDASVQDVMPGTGSVFARVACHE